MCKVKHYVSKQALHLLYHSLINSRVQYGIIAQGRGASCHLQPILAVSNLAIRCLNTHEPVAPADTNIYKTQKIIQLKDIYNPEVSKFSMNAPTQSYWLFHNNF